MAQTFDGPLTIKRSGSEHQRAVTSPLPEEEGLGEKVEPSLAKEGRGDSKNSSFEWRLVQSDTAMRNKIIKNGYPLLYYIPFFNV